MSEEDRTVVDEHGQTVLASSVEDKSGVNKDLVLFTFEIEINHGRDLIVADFMGKSDPFCKVTAEGRSFETRTIMKNLNPDWNERTQFTFFKPLNEVQFNVYDWDKGTKHDPIGECKLDTSAFCDENHCGFNGDLNLSGVKHGSINVSIKGRRIALSELERRIEKMDRQSTDNKAEIASQQPQITAKYEEFSRLSATNISLSNEKQRLEETNSELTQRVSELESSVETIQRNSGEIKRNIETIKDTNQQKSDAMDKMNDDRPVLMDAIHKSEVEMYSLKNDERQWKFTFQEREQSLRAAETELKRTADTGALTDPLLPK